MFFGFFFALNCFVFINTQNHSNFPFIKKLILKINFLFFPESENANSCVDSCSDGFSIKYQINLTDGTEENLDKDLVEILERTTLEQSNEECSKKGKH